MTDLLYAEITGESAKLWGRIDSKHREDLKIAFPFIAKLDGSKILFSAGWLFENDTSEITALEKRILSLIQRHNPHQNIRAVSISYIRNKRSLSALISSTSNFQERFSLLKFGSDAAEQDHDLLQYFLETPAYGRVKNNQKGIIIGPKGSGKSSILRALAAHNTAGQTIAITPEVFATSMLKATVEGGEGSFDDERAFVATWEFSILFEVFKQLSLDPKTLPRPALTEVRNLLRKYSEFEDDDLFSRFVRYLQKIQSVKTQYVEITVKTKELQSLFSLEPIYNLILKIRRHMKKNILILIDELDQGWDNSDHSNRFLAGLLQAAVQIQNLGIQAHVVVFVRSEIFDLVRTKLAQLDKIRSSIERLKWSDGELMNLISKRIIHHFNFEHTDAKELLGLLFETTAGVPGFDYLLSRTTRRPREVLQFTRLAHQYAAESKVKNVPTVAIIKAEEEFSNWKLEHVAAEYLHIYPNLEYFLRGFRGRQARFGRQVIELIIFELQEAGVCGEEWAKKDISELVQILYQIEFIGAKRVGKMGGTIKEIGEFEFYYEASSPNLNAVDEFLVHPAFWKALELSV